MTKKIGQQTGLFALCPVSKKIGKKIIIIMRIEYRAPSTIQKVNEENL
jgi:hypothetical protein